MNKVISTPSKHVQLPLERTERFNLGKSMWAKPTQAEFEIMKVMRDRPKEEKKE